MSTSRTLVRWRMPQHATGASTRSSATAPSARRAGRAPADRRAGRASPRRCGAPGRSRAARPGRRVTRIARYPAVHGPMPGTASSSRLQVAPLAFGRDDELARGQPGRDVDDRADARRRPAQHLPAALGDRRGGREQHARSVELEVLAEVGGEPGERRARRGDRHLLPDERTEDELVRVEACRAVARRGRTRPRRRTRGRRRAPRRWRPRRRRGRRGVARARRAAGGRRGSRGARRRRSRAPRWTARGARARVRRAAPACVRTSPVAATSTPSSARAASHANTPAASNGGRAGSRSRTTPASAAGAVTSARPRPPLERAVARSSSGLRS